MPQINNAAHCTLETCSLSYAPINYDPTLVGNALYLAIFGFLLIVQVLQLWRYRAWSFSCAVISGIVLELVGYLGRVQMHFNPFDPNPFLIYLICITVGPVFFSAAIYLTLSRIIVHYGLQHARISPKAISLTFMGCDLVALVLQAVGGAIADTANTQKESDQGTHIMVGGLSFQVLSLLLFIALSLEFSWNVYTDRRLGRFQGSPASVNKAESVSSKSERSFKVFLAALSLATIFILTRSCFRVAELAKGFGSKLANEETLFMILEGMMIILATVTLTAFHPGPVFGAKWEDAGWNWKTRLADVEAVQPDHEPSSIPSSFATK